MQTPVDNPIMTIESFNRQFQIGEKEREAVKWGWEQEMRKTMFHVVSAYTRVVQFEGLSAEASYRLQKVGGMVLGMIK
jgi:molybdopterin-guanine dinucleotide biosynthesis protein A